MTIEQVERRRTITKADLLMKAESEDWHGVADAAMDLREVDALLGMLKTNNNALLAADAEAEQWRRRIG